MVTRNDSSSVASGNDAGRLIVIWLRMLSMVRITVGMVGFSSVNSHL